MKEQLKNGYLRQFKDKFEEEYLHMEKDGRLCEKVVFRRIAAAVISILLCMSAMGFSAYAFFTSNVASESNKIEAAGYQAEYTVMKQVDAEGAAVTSESTEATPSTENVLTQLRGIAYPTYQLEAGTYQVTITIPETVTASKGYCKIIVGSALAPNENGETVIEDASDYYTCSLAPGDYLTFTIQNHENEAVVQFIANWGSCSVTDEAKLVERPEEGSDEQPEIITFGTAPSGEEEGSGQNGTESTTMLSGTEEGSKKEDSQGGAAQQPASGEEEDASNSDEVQQSEGQDTDKTESQAASQQNSDTDNTSESEAE